MNDDLEFGDNFDLDEFVRKNDQARAKEAAEYDQSIALFRLIWDRLKPGHRDRLRKAFADLDRVQTEILMASDGLLGPPNVAILADDAAERMEYEPTIRRSPYLEVSQAASVPFLLPGDLSKAIAAWERGEEFVVPPRGGLEAYDDAIPAEEESPYV